MPREPMNLQLLQKHLWTNNIMAHYSSTRAPLVKVYGVMEISH